MQSVAIFFNVIYYSTFWDYSHEQSRQKSMPYTLVSRWDAENTAVSKIKEIHALYLEKMKTLSQKDTCTPMFIAALFTIAKTWKQPKCISIERWMDEEDVVYLYNGILLSHKKEWNNAICSNMDGPRDYHTKWSKSDRERQISYDISYMWNI